MLKGISWKSYLSFLIAIAFAYYAVVIIVCYRKEILYFLRNGFKKETNVNEQPDFPGSIATNDSHDKPITENSL